MGHFPAYGTVLVACSVDGYPARASQPGVWVEGDCHILWQQGCTFHDEQGQAYPQCTPLTHTATTQRTCLLPLSLRSRGGSSPANSSYDDVYPHQLPEVFAGEGRTTRPGVRSKHAASPTIVRTITLCSDHDPYRRIVRRSPRFQRRSTTPPPVAGQTQERQAPVSSP